MITDPFSMNPNGIIDTETGVAIDVPLARQVPPGWLKENPEAYERIKEERKRRGLKIEDGYVENPPKPKTRKRTKFPEPRKRMAR